MESSLPHSIRHHRRAKVAKGDTNESCRMPLEKIKGAAPGWLGRARDIQTDATHQPVSNRCSRRSRLCR